MNAPVSKKFSALGFLLASSFSLIALRSYLNTLPASRHPSL